MREDPELVYGTCVALGSKAALLRGDSGSGKSDLALRFIALPPEAGLEPRLVADDQVVIKAKGPKGLVAAAPATLAGKIEVRGLGILQVPTIAKASLILVADLVPGPDVPRMPPEPWETARIAGIQLPLLRIAAFEPSAPLKLKLALLAAASGMPIWGA